MIQLWKKQFSKASFNLAHEDPSVFVKSQWQKDSNANVYYIMYRWIFAMMFLISWIMTIVDVQHLDEPASFRVKWLIYFTNWGFTLCTIQALLSAVMVSSCFLTARKFTIGSDVEKSTKAVKLYKVYWVANAIATDIAFAITVIFWSVVFDATTMSVDVMNVIVHALNSVLMFLDIWIVCHPVRFLHFYWSLLVALCYIIFNVIYYFAGGTNRNGGKWIYSIINWEQPWMTVLVCVLITIFIIVLHGFTYGTFRLRKYVHNRCRHDEKSSDLPVQVEGYINEGLANDIV